MTGCAVVWMQTRGPDQAGAGAQPHGWRWTGAGRRTGAGQPGTGRALELGLALGLALALGLSGCSAFQAPDPRTCPPVRFDAATATFATYGPGGKDITDLVLSGRITGYEGTCTYRDDGVTVDMYLTFALDLGPAARSREARFQYFVALPDLYPAPQAKRVFDASLTVPDGLARVRYRDEEISLFIPLAEGESAAALPVYVGFQVSADQLDDNRRRLTQPTGGQ